jgi:DNA topoisomerase I
VKRKSPPTSSDSDDDVPLGQRVQKAEKPQPPKKPKVKKAESDSDDDLPLAAKAKVKPKKAATPVKKVKKEEDTDDDIPLAKAKSIKRAKPISDSDDEPMVAKIKKAKVKSESTPRINGVKSQTSTPQPKPSKKLKKEDPEGELKPEEDDEEYKWWEAEQNDGSVKWTTLEHNGVLFPPPYEPLPSHVKMKYDGKEVSLPPEAEEVAGFFAALLESDHAKNPVFQQNFFNDWLEILKNCKAVCY